MKKPNVLKDFFTLLSFFTPIPVPKRFVLEDKLFRSPYLLPLIGFVRGTLIYAVMVILTVLLKVNESIILGALALFLHAFSQGFLHIDGFIDFSEAVIAHRFGANAYKVMKDTYRGSYAIAVSIITLILAFTFSTSLFKIWSRYYIITYLYVVEIWLCVEILFLAFIGNKPPEGMGRRFKENLKIEDLIKSVSIALSLTILILRLEILVFVNFLLCIILTLFLVLIISYLLSHKTLGFVSGDVLGFSAELFYLLSLITAYVWCGV